jgi:hypothetical protein
MVCVTCILRRPDLEPIAKPNNTEMNVLCEVFGTLRNIIDEIDVNARKLTTDIHLSDFCFACGRSMFDSLEFHTLMKALALAIYFCKA